MNNAYAVSLTRIAVLVRTEGRVTSLPFRTKRQADKKILSLIEQGYKFDRYLWAERKGQLAHLHVQAHDLCNALCGMLEWKHEPVRAARIRHALDRARVRLARRETLDYT